jgi:hypothetical protein
MVDNKIPIDGSKTGNQATREDDQNFDVDISQLYDDWIKPIEDLRGYSVTSDYKKIFDDLKNSNAADITSITSSLKVEKTPQESRCHAFYRWIGFPVVSKDYNIYNPGFDIIKNSSRSIDIDKKINIGKNQLPGFEELSNFREQFPKDNIKIFSKPTEISAGLLCLLSAGSDTLRQFNSPFKSSSGPFDMHIAAQSSSIGSDALAIVGSSQPISLSFFKDRYGNPASDVFVSLITSRYHIITPFIVDARIDFTISPQYNLIAVPFVPDSYAVKLDPVHSVKRPILEKIIRERFAPNNSEKDSGITFKDVTDYINNSLHIKDADILNKISSKDYYDQSAQSQLLKTIKIIRSVMSKLIDAKAVITACQSNYYYLPEPSQTGPENGCVVTALIPPTTLQLQKNSTEQYPEGKFLITKKDRSIYDSYVKSVLEDANPAAVSANSEPDNGSFKLPAEPILFNTANSSAVGDKNKENLDSLSKARAKVLKDANSALETIETIMGDFSGLGLCDIIAIIGALTTIPKEKLLGFLDADAQTRAIRYLKLDQTLYTDVAQGINPNFGASGTTTITLATYQEAMSSLYYGVSAFYDLMEKICIDIQYHNAH